MLLITLKQVGEKLPTIIAQTAVFYMTVKWYIISGTGGHIVDVHTVAIVVVSVTIFLNVGYSNPRPIDYYVGMESGASDTRGPFF